MSYIFEHKFDHRFLPLPQIMSNSVGDPYHNAVLHFSDTLSPSQNFPNNLVHLCPMLAFPILNHK